MNTPRTAVYAAIDGERDYQDTHTLNDDPKEPGFTTGDYITMMRHYVDDLSTAWALSPGKAPDAVMHDMRKIAAIAVQCMEAHGALPRTSLGQWGHVSNVAKEMAR